MLCEVNNLNTLEKIIYKMFIIIDIYIYHTYLILPTILTY